MAETEEGQWVKVNRIVDPYSFQISLVFTNWVGRFPNKNFQQLIRNIVSAEILTHLTPYYHWFDQDKMGSFEKAYTHWLNTIRLLSFVREKGKGERGKNEW